MTGKFSRDRNRLSNLEKLIGANRPTNLDMLSDDQREQYSTWLRTFENVAAIVGAEEAYRYSLNYRPDEIDTILSALSGPLAIQPTDSPAVAADKWLRTLSQ
ncbi:hypothetical protein ACSBOB_06680 [Mesorhizobium sp. ASY16-5R]|uniref:hypothetical protein n=1 Tax=Mesorhizobium sp. ASY16-5R TaxID=3445772 RepID=UPI003FA18052